MSGPSKLHIRLTICAYVAAYLMAAWAMGAEQKIFKSEGVNATIHYNPGCLWLARAVFVPGYVPTFKEYVRIKEQADRCNEQNP